MVKEGVLNNPKVDVISGLHINAQTEVEHNTPSRRQHSHGLVHKKSQVNKLMA
jgi:hypothetical protein